jgi:hypothetical protein
MSYNVAIHGHKNDVENSEQFETEAMEKTREFVSTLEGVDSATFTGGHIGSHDLLKPPGFVEPTAGE